MPDNPFNDAFGLLLTYCAMASTGATATMAADAFGMAGQSGGGRADLGRIAHRRTLPLCFDGKFQRACRSRLARPTGPLPVAQSQGLGRPGNLSPAAGIGDVRSDVLVRQCQLAVDTHAECNGQRHGNHPGGFRQGERRLVRDRQPGLSGRHGNEHQRIQRARVHQSRRQDNHTGKDRRHLQGKIQPTSIMKASVSASSM